VKDERVELPVAKVVKIGAAPEPEPAMAVAQLAPVLLAQLQEGNVNAALAIEEDWREAGGVDDLRGVDDFVRKQWPLLKELLGVASELPRPVTQAFARAIDLGDPAFARPSLGEFRASDPAAANAANGLLAGRARALHQASNGALYTAPTKPEYVPTFTTPRSSGVSGWRVVSIGAVALSGLLRLGLQESRSHDYDYHPIEIPQLDPQVYDLPPMPTPMTSVPAPRVPATPFPIQRGADRVVLLDEIVGEAQSIVTYGLVSPDDQPKVDTFLGDALDDACPRMRVSFAKVAKLAPIDDAEKAAAAKEQIAAIRERLDIVCAKTKPKTQSATGSSK
jgi:hypothetical protein